MTDALHRAAVEETAVFAGNMRRMAAAYRFRIATRAQALGAEAPVWEGVTISIDDEKRALLAEDTHRIVPYPYPGLRSFDPGEGEIFFGRERDIEAVRSLLARDRVVAVLGGSGSGKSSLLRAGLLPFLNTKRRIQGRFGNWYRTEFRPRTKPMDEFASALAEQLMRPLLRASRGANRARLGRELGLFWSDDGFNEDEAVSRLQALFRQRFINASKIGRRAVFDAFADIAVRQLDRADNIVTGGRRLAEPSLFLLVDQLEEVFRPEVCCDEREALLNLIVDLHAAAREEKGSVYLALTIRSEELHRCAEHRGLSNIVIGNGYQLELLEPADPDDRVGLRLAIVQPARNVFEDWGLRDWLKRKDKEADAEGRERDAPFSRGMPDLLLRAAERLSKELEHRPDQLPLLQHALQAIWHAAMKRWSRRVTAVEELEIRPADLPGYRGDEEVPDLGECLNRRADDASLQAAELFAQIGTTTKETGEDALRAAFRALARRDDIGNWARRFAGRDDIMVFLAAEPNSALSRMPSHLPWTALQTALNSFLLRGYLNRGGTGEYDISHEALIRNWKKFQLWLRDPREVAYSLGRVLKEVEEPDQFAALSDREKADLIPQSVAGRVAMVAKEGQLPTKWGEDQIAPILQNSATRARWGSTKSQALKKVIALASMADKARQNLQLGEFRKQLAAWLIGGAALIAVMGSLYYYHLDTVRAKEAQKMAEARRITALARDALWSDGPATAILVASRVQDLGLEEAPEAERLLLTSLHGLREERVLAREHRQMVNGISYSPDGNMLVTSDPASLLFSNAKNGVPVDMIDLSYLPIKSRKFVGPFIGAQWSPGGNWIAAGSRDQTLLIAPCSHKELQNQFAACANRDDDIIQVIGDATDRTGAAQFSADGKWMATGGFGTTVKLWDVSASPVRKLMEFGGLITWPNAFAISPDRQWIATGLGPTQGVVKVFDALSGEHVATLEASETQHGSFIAIAFNPNDPRMLVASASDGSIFVWDNWRDSAAARSPAPLEKTRGMAFQMAFSRDSGFFVAASDDGVLRMWATDEGRTDSALRQVGELRGHRGPVWAIAVSPDGNHIASGSTDGSIISWSRQSAFHTTQGSSTAAGEMSPAQDLSVCAAGLKLPREFGTPAACVRSPDGRVVVASTNGQIEEFNREDGTIAVDGYRVASGIAALKLEGDRLIVETRSGERTEWPFFDSLKALIDFSLAHLPYDRAERVKLPTEILCRIDDRSAGCGAQSMRPFAETP